MRNIRRVAKVFGGIVLTLVLISSIVGCDESASGPKPTPTPVPTSTPAPNVSYGFLLAEREANATRFDAKYKDKYVELDAVVIGVDDGKVKIAGPSGFLDDGVIEDLPKDLQIQLDKGMRIMAVCKVGSYMFGSMYFDSCILPISIVN